MKSHPPSCPRCGYDLSGDVASWNGADSPQCPCAGRCSECGLEFEWSDIFDPFRNRVRGFIEHEDRGLYRAAWRTWLLAARPWRFWKLVKIEFEPRVGRMLLWLVILAVSVWIIGPLVCNATQLYLVLTKSVPVPLLEVLQPWISGVLGEEFRPSGYRLAFALRHAPAFILGPLAASIMIPLVLLCLPDTRRLARVRSVHVARAAVYGFAWLIPMLLLKSLNQIGEAVTWIAWSQRGPATTRRAPPAFGAYNDVYSFIRHTWVIWLLLVLAWLAAWWWCALRTGWRLKEYDKVMRALIIIGLLAAAVAIALSDDGCRAFL
jgi:hypothetical protein